MYIINHIVSKILEKYSILLLVIGIFFKKKS